MSRTPLRADVRPHYVMETGRAWTIPNAISSRTGTHTRLAGRVGHDCVQNERKLSATEFFTEEEIDMNRNEL